MSESTGVLLKTWEVSAGVGVLELECWSTRALICHCRKVAGV